MLAVWLKKSNTDWQNPQLVRRAAIDLLARREHSLFELERKLIKKGISQELLNTVLEQLTIENLQSDQRFTESFIYHRMGQGYGPLRIRQELCERGIASFLIEQALCATVADWSELAYKAAIKKFGEAWPQDLATRAKLIRFLQYRGFSFEHMPNNKASLTRL
jgi:regulatory protein